MTADPITMALAQDPESKYTWGYIRGLCNELAMKDGNASEALARTVAELVALELGFNSEIIEWVRGYIAGAREARESS